MCVATMLLAVSGLGTLALAEPRVVTASGEYRMGERDTREDAITLATEAAKRHVLEQVATYLESVTVVRDLDVTRDEIRTYSAGMVAVLDRRVTTRLDGETIVVRVDLTAQVDSDEVARAITALRRQEDARQELVALKAEVEQLERQLDAANQALARATMPEEVRQLGKQRQDLLNKMQSDTLVSQAWTDWVILAPVLAFSPAATMAQLQALIAQAREYDPSNPHIRALQQAIAARQPPAPPKPPTPSGAPSHAPRMPTYQVTPQNPLSLSSPPTLNHLPQAATR